MTIDEALLHTISTYIYADRNRIPIIDTIEINDFIYCRLDILLTKYYGAFENRIQLYPLLLDFNNISDPTNIKIGTVIDIPDFETLVNQLQFSDDSVVNGINKFGKLNDLETDGTNDKTAVPKLNIKRQQSSYNPDTGEISF